MDPLNSVIDGCDIRFEWTEGNNGGLSITNFRLEVQTINGEFQHVEACESGTG